ncbi:MAG: Rha family transcriptional regulator [Epsilonproteobacteria bacterium]|nr:Rha family transcriptional regulator [Campylobacterota bacterium]
MLRYQYTVNSRDIADMTGKKHNHVIRDIKNMLDGLEIDASKFASIYLDAYNREKPMFILPKREALILLLVRVPTL